jgi:hypothetical protein
VNPSIMDVSLVNPKMIPNYTSPIMTATSKVFHFSLILVFSLPTMNCVKTLDVGVPVNYTCINSDSSILCAASDSEYISLYDCRNAYKEISKLKDFNDGCFSCCFDPTFDSLHF